MLSVGVVPSGGVVLSVGVMLSGGVALSVGVALSPGSCGLSTLDQSSRDRRAAVASAPPLKITILWRNWRLSMVLIYVLRPQETWNPASRSMGAYGLIVPCVPRNARHDDATGIPHHTRPEQGKVNV